MYSFSLNLFIYNVFPYQEGLNKIILWKIYLSFNFMYRLKSEVKLNSATPSKSIKVFKNKKWRGFFLYLKLTDSRTDLCHSHL